MAANKTQGYYYFSDGSYIWVTAMKSSKLKVEEKYRGKLVRFVRTYL